MQKGFALITVLAVLIMVALGTATVLQSLGSQAGMKSVNLQELQDQYLAEAGMQHALWVCRKNNGNCSSLNMTSPNVTLPKATTGLGQDINIKTDPASGTGPYKIKVCVGEDATNCVA